MKCVATSSFYYIWTFGRVGGGAEIYESTPTDGSACLTAFFSRSGEKINPKKREKWADGNFSLGDDGFPS